MCATSRPFFSATKSQPPLATLSYDWSLSPLFFFWLDRYTFLGKDPQNTASFLHRHPSVGVSYFQDNRARLLRTAAMNISPPSKILTPPPLSQTSFPHLEHSTCLFSNNFKEQIFFFPVCQDFLLPWKRPFSPFFYPFFSIARISRQLEKGFLPFFFRRGGFFSPFLRRFTPPSLLRYQVEGWVHGPVHPGIDTGFPPCQKRLLEPFPWLPPFRT